MAWVSLCRFDELKEGEGKFVEINGWQLAVFLHEGKAYALDNRCPHAGGSISGGWIKDGCAVCPWHHWSFRLDNGQMPGAPLVKVHTYQVRLLQREGKPTMVQAELPIR